MTAPVLLALAVGLAPADPPRFVATTPDGDTPPGSLAALAADGAGSVVDRGQATPFRDLVGLRREDGRRPAFPRGPGLVTATGDRVPGRLVGGDADALRFRPRFGPADGPEWAVPLSSAAVLWLAHPPADTPADPARYPWLADARRRDTLLLANGDTLRGTVERFAADGSEVRFKPDGQPGRAVPIGQVAAVAFDPSLARTRRPKGAYSRVVFANGARLDLTAVTVADGRLRGKTRFGAAADVPLADVAALDVLQGKAVYLSDLKPKKAETAGYLGVAWPVGADRSASGDVLRVAGATFDKGVGLHPRAVVTYDLGGKYRRFEAVVGLDPAAGGRGRAAVRVLVDGKEREVPGLVSLSATAAVPVRVDVTGAKELTLEVGFGPTGGVQADVTWGNARLAP